MLSLPAVTVVTTDYAVKAPAEIFYDINSWMGRMKFVFSYLCVSMLVICSHLNNSKAKI
jgi:hypothetical protein